jgi:hypothetical protein
VWFIVDVDTSLGSFYCVDVRNAGDVSHIYPASIFRAEMYSVGE